jgi:uncharacterized protein DUF4340
VSPRRLAVLLVLALAAIGGAFWLSRPRTLPRDPALGTPVLPGLAATLDQVSGVRLVGAGEQVLVTLERAAGRWQVKERGYAADGARVRRLLVTLGDLHVLEAKTSEPAHYPALGVEDIADAKAQGVRIELLGLTAPRSLLVGRTAGTQGNYVRLPGRAPALEARPALDLPHAPRDWLARAFLDVASDRVASVEVARADAPPWHAERKARNAAHFDVPALPRGRELTSAGAADPAAHALANLEFDEVRATVPAVATEHVHRAVVRCFDGLTVTLAGRVTGEERWLNVEASFDPALAARFPPATSPATTSPAAAGADEVLAEAARISSLTRGWEYRLPPYRFDAIFRARDELLRH